jgi:hypothetical protein
MGSWQSVHASLPNRVGPLKDASTGEPDHRIPETKKTPYQILPSSGEVNHDAVRTCQPGSRNLPRRVTGRTRRQRPWLLGSLWPEQPRSGSRSNPWLSSWHSNDRRPLHRSRTVRSLGPLRHAVGSRALGCAWRFRFRSHLTRLQSFVGIPFFDLRRRFRMRASAASMRLRQEHRSPHSRDRTRLGSETMTLPPRLNPG